MRNIETAMDVGIQLLLRGHDFYCPHLTGFVEERAFATGIYAITYEHWLQYDRVWQTYCEALYYLASSPGADAELAWAEENGMRVFRSLDEVPDEH